MVRGELAVGLAAAICPRQYFSRKLYFLTVHAGGPISILNRMSTALPQSTVSQGVILRPENGPTHPATPVPLVNLPGHEEPGAFFGAHGTSPWDHPARAGFSNPANEILTLESDNNYPEKLSIIFQKTVNSDSSNPPIVPRNIPCIILGPFPWI